jgi:hypothetical protein
MLPAISAVYLLDSATALMLAKSESISLDECKRSCNRTSETAQFDSSWYAAWREMQYRI